MKVLAINGSPRPDWNDGILLKACLEQAEEMGCETEFVQLSALDFRGCRSCLACKLDREPFRSKPICAVKDDLSPVLDKIHETDVLIIAAPIYYGSLTADTYGMLERLWFSAMHYDFDREKKWPREVVNGLIITRNNPVPGFYDPLLSQMKQTMEMIVGPSETLDVADTCQFDDYSKYITTMFDVKAKEARRLTPDCEDVKRAKEFAKGLVERAQG